MKLSPATKNDTILPSSSSTKNFRGFVVRRSDSFIYDIPASIKGIAAILEGDSYSLVNHITTLMSLNGFALSIEPVVVSTG